jgi:hypothetical protein
MPWLRLYMIDDDVEQLCRMLDEDPEIALIRSAGKGRWKAQRNVPTLHDGQHALWHIPSGPIELEDTKPKSKPKKVKDPFAGWKEIVKPVEPGVPWFGPGPLGIFWLNIQRQSRNLKNAIGLSTISWIGNEYRIIGYPAPEATERWWKSLRRRIAKLAEPVASSGRFTSKPRDVWAFPAALGQIRKGVKRADNS